MWQLCPHTCTWSQRGSLAVVEALERVRKKILPASPLVQSTRDRFSQVIEYRQAKIFYTRAVKQAYQVARRTNT